MNTSFPLFTCLALACALPGCSEIGDNDGGPDGDSSDDGGDSCADARYDNGSCDIDLACDAPDIDCFVLFDDQAAADQFFAEHEARSARIENREPRPTLPVTDPEWLRMRELLDRGWDAYEQVNRVGRLAAETPALVVVEDEAINAFAFGNTARDRSGFIVAVHTGLLARGFSDAAMLGLVMHELEHSVRLHTLDPVRDRIRKFYVANGEEPFGFEQPDDPVARTHGEAWRSGAELVGAFSSAELGGLPFAIGQADLPSVLTTVLSRVSGNPACAGPLAEHAAIQGELFATFDSLVGTIEVPVGMRGRIDALMADLRNSCAAGFGDDLLTVAMELSGLSREALLAEFEPSDRPLIEGTHIIDAIEALTLGRRERMRRAESEFEYATGAPWSALRIYGFEEAADDATVPVLHELGLPGDGLSELLLGIMREPDAADCAAIIEAGEVPDYGADLFDEHHANCWRIDHLGALAADNAP